MAMRSKILAVLMLAILLALLAASPILGAGSPAVSSASETGNPALGAALPTASINSRVWTDQTTGVQVVVEGKSLYAPPRLDRQVSYPDELNYIPYLRYAVNGTRGDGTDANAVVVALSGLHAGNNGFDCFAKQLVSKAKAYRGMNVELWALDRRVNNLEDTTGLNEAERLGQLAAETGNPALLEQAADAIDQYYYGDLAIDGKRFQGFLTDETAPYLSEFGLRVAMEDIYTLITTMFPDQNVRKKRVYVAGDSLGAVVTADFACWDFDGNPATVDDAGYNNIAGVIALDALMTPNAVPINNDFLQFAMDFLPGSMQNLLNMSSLSVYAQTLNMLRNGTLDVLLPTSEVGYVPETYLGVEVNAMMADAAPDEESDFYERTKDLPVDPRTDEILRLCCSRNLFQYLSGEVWQKKLRFTNEALFGMVFDNNFNPIVMNQSAMGFLTGGRVSEKSFPAIGNLDAILPSFIWNPISGFMPYDKMYIPTSTSSLYSWVNSDEIDATDASRYTSSRDEISDLHDVAKCCYEGPSNIAEWYYTTRIFADIMIANTSGANSYGLNMLHQNRLDDVPTFIRLNEEGTNIGYAEMNNIDTRGITMPGQHLDVLMMDMDRDPNAKNYLYMPMCDWMDGISGPIETFEIAASAGAGGSIDPAGTVSVVYGSDQAFTINANTGYHVADVLVDGASVGAVTSYTFSGVTADHTIQASFAIDTFTITASAGSGGIIAPSGNVTVNYGSDQAFTITANTGYHVADVLVDGASVGDVTGYTFTGVAADHTIAVSFAPDSGPGLPPTVTSINPNSGAPNTSVDVTIEGTDFQGGASVRLQNAGTVIDASNVNTVSSTQISCTIDLTGAPEGAYDVVVRNPDAQEGLLGGGFNVTTCGTGAAAAVLMLGLSLGLLSLASTESRRRRRRKKRNHS